MSDRDPSESDAVSLSWLDADNTTDGVPPTLVRPVVVAAFEGWNDAGEAASTALEHLELSWDASPLAAMDPDDYYDFQVTRPTVHLVDGITRRIEWPTTRLSVCRPPGADHDVVLVRGIEPNMRWRGFCSELLTYLERLGATTIVTLGALLTDTPHTRPVPVSGTAYDAESAAKFGLETSRYQGSTGIVGVFQDACVRAGIPAISFWAAVPHYVSQAPDPKAAVALLHRVEEVLDLEVPLGVLPDRAEAWEQTVSEMADADDEVREYVRSLEERTESESALPEMSGETIAADFERYLRRRGPGGSGPGRPGGRGGGPGA
jgi:proteasome assembly chaperone (PAC2) family protein